MPVDWRAFGEQLRAWEREASSQRFMSLCSTLERAVRRAFRRDDLLDFGEVTDALDCIAQEIVHMRRAAEGRKPCERIAIEVEAGLADRLRKAAQGEGLEVSELVAAVLDRLLLAGDEPARPARRGRMRRRRGEQVGEEDT